MKTDSHAAAQRREERLVSSVAPLRRCLRRSWFQPPPVLLELCVEQLLTFIYRALRKRSPSGFNSPSVARSDNIPRSVPSPIGIPDALRLLRSVGVPGTRPPIATVLWINASTDSFREGVPGPPLSGNKVSRSTLRSIAETGTIVLVSLTCSAISNLRAVMNFSQFLFSSTEPVLACAIGGGRCPALSSK